MALAAQLTLIEHETHAQKQTLCVERICQESETGRRRFGFVASSVGDVVFGPHNAYCVALLHVNSSSSAMCLSCIFSGVKQALTRGAGVVQIALLTCHGCCNEGANSRDVRSKSAA